MRLFTNEGLNLTPMTPIESSHNQTRLLTNESLDFALQQSKQIVVGPLHIRNRCGTCVWLFRAS